jgi:hypothetical protein
MLCHLNMSCYGHLIMVIHTHSLSCHSCQFMSFMSIPTICSCLSCHVSLDFQGNSVKLAEESELTVGEEGEGPEGGVPASWGLLRCWRYCSRAKNSACMTTKTKHVSFKSISHQAPAPAHAPAPASNPTSVAPRTARNALTPDEAVRILLDVVDRLQQ